MRWKIRDLQEWTRYHWYTSLSDLARKNALKYNLEGQRTTSFGELSLNECGTPKTSLRPSLWVKNWLRYTIFWHSIFVRGKLDNFSDDITAPVESKILVISTSSDFTLIIHVTNVPNWSLISGESVKHWHVFVPRRFVTTKSQILSVRYPSNDHPLWRHVTSLTLIH